MSDAALAALARRLLDATYAGFAPFELMAVDLPTFTHLDLRAYAQRRAWFESRRFRHLGELEMPAITRAPNALLQRTCMSTHVSRHGSIVGAYYQVKCRPERLRANLLQGLRNGRLIAAPLNLLRNLGTRHVVEFTTRLDDGSELSTSNAQAASALQRPPFLDAHHLPMASPPDAVLKAHVTRVKARMATEPERTVVPIDDLDEAIESARHTHERKRAFRESIGWLRPDELLAYGTHPAMVEALHEQIQRLVQADASAEVVQ